jgi:hypothetical protein
VIVSTLLGQSTGDVIRGYRLHVTNLEPRPYVYTVTFNVTPPSSESIWAAPLQEFFATFLNDVMDPARNGVAGVTEQRFRRDGTVYTVGLTFSVESRQTVSVGLVPRSHSTEVGTLRTIEGYVTLNLPVVGDPSVVRSFRRVPQSRTAVKVLVNPETTMVNKDNLRPGYTRQLDGVVTGTVSVTRLDFNVTEALVTASGKAENEVIPDGSKSLDLAPLQSPHGAADVEPVPVEVLRGASAVPDEERARALVELLCELDENAEGLVLVNEVLAENDVRIRLNGSA